MLTTKAQISLHSLISTFDVRSLELKSITVLLYDFLIMIENVLLSILLLNSFLT